MDLRAVLRRSPFYSPYVKAKYRSRSSAREELFTGYFKDNIWGEAESRSGSGSTMANTEAIREWLPILVSGLGVETMLDVPCGDFTWMQHVDLGEVDYVGGDIVSELIDGLQERFGEPGRRFRRIDLVTDALPLVDLIMVRDLFLHLPTPMVFKAIANIRRSGSMWLLVSHSPEVTLNIDVELGRHRYLNMTAAPFGWPEPQELLMESATDERDKHLALWRIADLPGGRH